MGFPIDVAVYRPVKIPLSQERLTDAQRVQLRTNIGLLRDITVFITAYSNAKGLGGHTGGPYDIVPEFQILDAIRRAEDNIYPVFFDAAGHRVAIHYIMAALNSEISGISVDDLLLYREFGAGLPGHPEIDDARGIGFSSGRLGHLFAFANGIALSHPDKKVVVFSSDGSLQEGTDAEAARFAVARQLNVKVFVDDNDMTITGHPSSYLTGFDIAHTLSGQGLLVEEGDGEDLDGLFARIRRALLASGPVAVLSKRPIAPGISGIEGNSCAHDAITPVAAQAYLYAKGLDKAAELIRDASALKRAHAPLLGSTTRHQRNRDEFGKVLCDLIDGIPREERPSRVLVIDSDLAGSCGLHHVQQHHSEVFVAGGVMERHNFMAAAGFGSCSGKQGVFSTFAAFLEMLISEVTMARLNRANVLAHFSHSGVDDIADNTSHFGLSDLFADNGLGEDDPTRLYFPADAHQLRAVLERVFDDSGLRFVFTTRSSVPCILDERGRELFHPQSGYRFEPGKDELIRDGRDGFVVSYGESLARALDSVEHARREGIDVGLVNKPTLNIVDEAMMRRIGQASFVLLVESQHQRNGLGNRLGTWLLERGLTPRYEHIGTTKPGAGGLGEQVAHQKLDPASILAHIRRLARESHP
jgi:transketolase C-terminal domain/subunit/transketolase N-terminal domain/subunit